MIVIALIAGIVAVAVFVAAAGIVSDELCSCPYECGVCAPPKDRNP